MRIGIDYREAVREKRAGKGIVVFELVQRLKDVIKDDEVVLYSNIDFDITGWPKNFSQKIIKLPDVFYHLRMTWEIWFGGLDRYLSLTSFLAPALAMSDKSIIMVHDMVAFLPEFSKQHNQKAIWLERLSLGWAVKFVRSIIVPSRATADDLERILPASQDKIQLIFEGFNYYDTPVPELGIDRYGDYIFFVSTLEPRKNLIRLFKVVNRLRREKGWAGKVLLAGKKGWFYSELFNLVKELELQDVIVFLGYVTDEEKFEYMRGAKLVYSVSLYEGFGLPVLEGMASGVPVITSNVSSMPEVAAEAAEVVDPLSEEEIFKGVNRILENREYADKLVATGKKQVKQFTWEKMAREVFDLISKN